MNTDFYHVANIEAEVQLLMDSSRQRKHRDLGLLRLWHHSLLDAQCGLQAASFLGLLTVS